MAKSRQNKICFTVDQLLLLLAISNKAFIERPIDDQTDELAGQIVYMQSRKPQLDQGYLDRLLGAVQAPPGQTTVAATRELVEYATSPPPRKGSSAWDKWERTGEEIATLGTIVAKIPPLAWAGEPLEFIGGLTALIANVGGEIASIWED